MDKNCFECEFYSVESDDEGAYDYCLEKDRVIRSVFLSGLMCDGCKSLRRRYHKTKHLKTSFR